MLFRSTQILPSFGEPNASLGNIRSWHGHILNRWLIKMIPILAITILVLSLIHLKKFRLGILDSYQKYFWFFLLLGLAGTLPFTLTLKQASYYLIPAVPFFTIAIGIALARGLQQLIAAINTERKVFKSILIFSWILLSSILVFNLFQIGKTDWKHKDLLNDIHRVGKEIPKGSHMKFSEVDGIVPLYFSRYYYIIPDGEESVSPFMLVKKTERKSEVPGFKQVDFPLKIFFLLERQD